MGRDVYIGSGCVIGEDGFAYDYVDGKLKRSRLIERSGVVDVALLKVH